MKINRLHKSVFSYSLGLALAGFIPFSAVAAVAEENYLDLSPEQLLSAHVVSASKMAETVADAPAAVYVITQEDIARSGVTSIPDALRMAPGLDVARVGSGWAVNIRGFNRGLANQLLVMVDGRTIYNPLFAGTYWEIRNIPLENIARIEVIRGPGGTLWGANAVNGVINIITKTAQETQGNLVRATVGNFEHDGVLAQRGGKIGTDGYYRVYGQHENDGALRNSDNPQDTMRDTRTGFRYDRNDSLTISGDAFVNGSDQFFTVPQMTPPYAVLQVDNHQSQGANILANWNKKYEDGSRLSLQSYIDYTQHNQVILDDQEDIFDFDAQYNMRRYGLNEVVVGGGYRLTHEAIGDSSTLSINPALNNLNLFNFFAQDKMELVPDRWFLTLGSKVEHNDFTGFEYEPNVRLQWFIDNRQSMWASVSKAVRTPSPFENELDLLDAVIPPNSPPVNLPLPLKFEVIANPGFQSEQTVAYEVGYRNKITPKVSTDITAFSNLYRGLDAQQVVTFTDVPLVNPQYTLLQTEQANLMTAETWGLEMASDWDVRSNWKLSGSISLLEMFLHLTNDGFNYQGEERQSPNYQANLRSYWNINSRWTLDTSLYYVDKLKAFNLPAYVRFDTNVGWRLGDGMQLNFVGQNLLQSAHTEYGSPTAGEVPRTFYAKITCTF